MANPNDRRGSGGSGSAGAPFSGAPRPDLKVGDIEIYGGHVVIGGVPMTQPSPGAPVAGTGSSNPLLPVPATQGSAVQGAPPAVAHAPSASTGHAPVVLASPHGRTAGVPGTLTREADGEVSRLQSRPSSLGMVRSPASVGGQGQGVTRSDVHARPPVADSSLDSALLELFPPLSTPMGKGMLAGAGVGLSVGAAQLINLGLPAEVVIPAVLGVGVLGLIRLLARRGGRGTQLKPVEAALGEDARADSLRSPASTAERERALVLLADRQGGLVRVVDVVRELRLSFDEAQALLTTLCSKGHASVEFDPQTQGPVYRIGG